MGKKEIRLSVAVATFNEEKNLDRCLASVRGIAEEIIVVDGGSSDATVSIAKKHGANVISTNNPSIFHINKQKVLDACRGDWILQLDADECVTDELRNEIVGIVHLKLATDTSQPNGYYIPRRNYFWGHWMRKGGQYPDYVIRLIQRGKARFPCRSVHEQIAVSGSVGYLKHPMLHYSYCTRDDYWRKADAYTSLTAAELVNAGVPKNIWTAMNYVVWKPLATFLNIFIRHKGFLDGVTGLEFALYSGLHWAIAYKKFLKV